MQNGQKRSDPNQLQKQSVSEVIRRMEISEKGTPKQNIENMVIALEYDPVLAGSIRKNELTDRIDIVKPMWWKREESALTDTDEDYLMMYLEKMYGLNNEKKIRKALAITANNHWYHPIQDRLNALKWDGTERIRYVLHHFLGADTSDLTYACMKLFLLGGISRIFHKGCKFETMLCLVGAQGAGKSTFARLLALQDEWFSDDLKNLNDENVYRKMAGHFIIEFSEMLATMNARSAEEIKSFLSRQKETYKVPYETHPKDRPRQCVFIGTTNKKKFLPFDRTGARRFMVVQCNAERAEADINEDEAASRVYIDQVWAEAMEIYRHGKFRLALPKEMERKLQVYIREFMPDDTREGVIQGFLDDYTGKYVCTRLLYAEAFNHLYDEPREFELRDISEIMNTSIKGWRKCKQHRYRKYGVQWSWERDPAAQDVTDSSKNTGGFSPVPRQVEIPFDTPDKKTASCTKESDTPVTGS